MENLVRSKRRWNAGWEDKSYARENVQHKDLQHIRSIFGRRGFEDQIRRTARRRWTRSGKDSWEARDGIGAALDADIAISRGEAGETTS
jgi:hypothetical protein